jgi:hypothetical protein
MRRQLENERNEKLDQVTTALTDRLRRLMRIIADLNDDIERLKSFRTRIKTRDNGATNKKGPS